MSFFRVFDPGQQFFDDNGAPADGYQIFVYTAGTSTKVTTYKDNAGAASHTNPIILGSDGKFPGNELWVQSGTYKFVLASPTDTDPPSSGETLMDNVKGINDTDASSVSEWTASGQTPTRTGNTTFTMVGDQTTEFHVGRRLQFTDSSTLYGTIIASSFSSPDTTVTVEMDSGSLSASLSAVSYGIVSYANTSVKKPLRQLTGTSGSGVLTPYEGLEVKKASASTVDVDADALLLTDANGEQILVESVNLTINITASGALGIDTGSEANSTWYYVWVLAQVDGTVTAVLSTATAFGSVTLPTDYVYGGFVGAIYNASGGDIDFMHQKGDTASSNYESQYNGDPGTSFTSQAVSIPANCHEMFGDILSYNDVGANGYARGFIASESTVGAGRQSVINYNTTNGNIVGACGYRLVILTSQTVYIAVNAADDNMQFYRSGWTF